jgi:ketosteroid isomerase-like protein
MTAASPQECMKAFTAALIRRDIAGALSLVANDAIFFYSNGTTLRGKEAFAATMTANWQRISDYKYETRDPAWILETNNAAAVVYAFSWSAKVGDNAASGSGRATRIFRRERVGLFRSGWLLTHEHLSQGSGPLS